jgi:hypothetical protein
MRYLYAASLVAVFAVGAYVGARFFTRDRVVETVGPTVEKELIRTVTKTIPGKETVTTQIVERLVTKPSPKAPQASQARTKYRLGLQIRPGQTDLRYSELVAGYRLHNNLWLQTTYDLKHKDITLGFTYEF